MTELQSQQSWNQELSSADLLNRLNDRLARPAMVAVKLDLDF